MEKHPLPPIIFFDGHCNLCNNTVNWIIRNDKKSHFSFVAVPQDEKFWDNIPNGDVLKSENSVILLENQIFSMKSTAVIKICRKLGFPYNLMSVFMVIPPFVRNAIYHFIARNRYRWFGHTAQCMVPDESIKMRFLSNNDPDFLKFFPKKEERTY